MKTLRVLLLFLCTLAAQNLMCGCSHFTEEQKARAAFEEADDLFRQGKYQASLDRYGRIIGNYPATGDRALFEIGIIQAHPENGQKEYRKSLESFRKVIDEYPESRYRQDSEMMIFYINNGALKDGIIEGQQKQIEALRQEVERGERHLSTLRQEVDGREKEIDSLKKKIEALRHKVAALRTGPVDKVLIEKKARRLTLISNGEMLRTYTIALGGNPDGPKERLGDNKTPEGTYTIDSRNRDSDYHLSLHISYPNEKDIRRAKELGVSPGGNIMIHGMKKGFPRLDHGHPRVDWTNGCIAVTDEEIEEIEKLVPDGTPVEIRP